MQFMTTHLLIEKLLSSSDPHPDNYSDILSDIPSERDASIYWMCILTFYLTFFLAYVYSDILSGILSGMYSDILFCNDTSQLSWTLVSDFTINISWILWTEFRYLRYISIIIDVIFRFYYFNNIYSQQAPKR